jgi:2-polyprenyl-3-methyl-5-hydroxy-6-metoxy-1,4-benzoquinol methylase
MSGAPAAVREDVACPICGSATRRWFEHPEGEIHRCPRCTHAFTRLDTMRAFETYDEQYQQTHKNWFRNPNRALFRWIDRHLPATTASVLDVGCGSGALLRYLRAQRSATRLVGLDLYCKDEIPGIEMRQGDVMTQPVADCFDAVTSLAAIEHVPDVRVFTERLIQACSPGGTVVVMTLNGDSILYMAARLARRVGIGVASNRLYSSHHLHHFSARSLRVLMEQSGLEVEAVHHHNAPMNALDLPATNRVIDPVLKVGVATAFAVGRATRRCYLQTIVCRKPG